MGVEGAALHFLPMMVRAPRAADLLANSTEQNQCGKVCSHHGPNPDRNMILVLPCSTIMRHIGRAYRLAVTSPADPPRAGAHHHRKKMWGLILGEGSSGPLPPQAIARRSKDSG